MRTTEIEVRDPNTNTIPIDVRFDPETEIGELNHYLINQDGNEITITLEMAASLLTAIKRLELSRPQRHSGRWEDNFKTVAEPVQEPVAWTNYNGAVNNRLKGAPVDAKAIRAEALEEAAKVCDETLANHYSKQDRPAIEQTMLFAAIADCAAAIRGLK